MKKMLAATLGLAFVTIVGRFAQASETPKPIVLKDKVSVKATVEAIDHTNRTVTLKGPKGNLVTLEVDPAVTRFDAMKVGDTVSAQYYESVAYEIQKPGAVAAPDTVTAGGGKISGDKPGGAVMEKSVTTVTITAIDLATPAVTIRTSDGAIESHRVRDVKNLEGVKVGDKVQVTQTAALMIAVAPAK
jgi:hypothetical protein